VLVEAVHQEVDRIVQVLLAQVRQAAQAHKIILMVIITITQAAAAEVHTMPNLLFQQDQVA
jgi:hypothetical protein